MLGILPVVTDLDTERQMYFSKVKIIAQLSHNLYTLKLALFSSY